MKLHEIIQYPVATEKGIRMMEAENKLIFIVDSKATKPQIREALEKQFKIKVDSVHTSIMKGKKRAYVKLAPESPAIDIATEFGMM